MAHILFEDVRFYAVCNAPISRQELQECFRMGIAILKNYFWGGGGYIFQYTV